VMRDRLEAGGAGVGHGMSLCVIQNEAKNTLTFNLDLHSYNNPRDFRF
jgi:hypothetical protein